MPTPASASTSPRRCAAARYSGCAVRLEAQYTHTARASGRSLGCEVMACAAAYAVALQKSSVLHRTMRRRRCRGQLARLGHPSVTGDLALARPLDGRELAVHVLHILRGPFGDLPEVEYADAVQRTFQHLRHAGELCQIVRLAVAGVCEKIATAFAHADGGWWRVFHQPLQRIEPLVYFAQGHVLGRRKAHGTHRALEFVDARLHRKQRVLDGHQTLLDHAQIGGRRWWRDVDATDCCCDRRDLAAERLQVHFRSRRQALLEVLPPARPLVARARVLLRDVLVMAPEPPEGEQR